MTEDRKRLISHASAPPHLKLAQYMYKKFTHVFEKAV